MLFQSTGVLRYSIVAVGHKLIVEADQELANFYRKLIPKYKHVQPQMYRAHISVVRHETPVSEDFWGAYEGEEVEFFYDNDIKHGQVYYWLNIFCQRLEKIRLELGLPVSSQYTLPPERFTKAFHLTLGNTKDCQPR